ncbi:hypothetical protein Droror1_Dr00001202 [Drosera rotundifolia]
MNGTSEAIVGATVLVTVTSLAIVFCLVLVVLAELYCSFLLSRRQLIKGESSSDTVAAEEAPSPQLPDQVLRVVAPLSSSISHGVLHVPSTFFSQHRTESAEEPDDIEKCSKKHQFLSTQSSPEISTRSSLSERNIVRGESAREVRCGRGKDQLFVYISNPVYDRDSRMTLIKDTPFETPETSPSRLEQGGYLADDSDEHEMVAKKFPSGVVSISTSLATPPLTPMKKLPSSACSVVLQDASLLVTSGSECNSHHGGPFSSSGTPCTSPSW